MLPLYLFSNGSEIFKTLILSNFQNSNQHGMGPKSVLDPKEPDNKLGPENYFQFGSGLGQKG